MRYPDRPEQKEERRVWIAQCLCPARHCILATAGEAHGPRQAYDEVELPLREKVAEMLLVGQINPWCSLCRATAAKWVYELGRTRFRTMAEAKPELMQAEAEQRVVNAMFGDIPRSD